MKKALKKLLRAIYFFPLGKEFLLRIILDDDEKVLLDFKKGGFFMESGWFKSLQSKLPVDQKNKPLPWLTYSAIYFLLPKLSKDMTVLEYGSGNSTLFFSEKTGHVTSIENDRLWYHNIKNLRLDNLEIYHKSIDDKAYADFPQTLNKKYDIVLIDGRDRNNCCRTAIKIVKNHGVIIFDDTHRERYRDGISFLLETGFRNLEFWGISPGDYGKKCTSVFYRRENIFGI